VKNYLKRPQDLMHALRSLRSSGMQVGLPFQTPAGEMLFQLDASTLSAAQILELLDKNELDRDGVRKFYLAQKTITPKLEGAIREPRINKSDEILRILVADDSTTSRKLAELAFRRKPFQVFFAEGGNQALNLIASHRPDVVITDWMMHDLSGLDLCRIIRTKLNCRDTYLILSSSNPQEAQKAEGIAAGADGYLTKPLRSDELLGQICAARDVIKTRRDLAANPISRYQKI
jgi:CheY-like chemotaxis protein